MPFWLACLPWLRAFWGQLLARHSFNCYHFAIRVVNQIDIEWIYALSD